MLARETGEPRGEAEARNTLGTICHNHGDHDDAIAHHLLAREPARRTGDSYTETEALLGLAAAHQHRGDTELALAAAREARTTAAQHGYRLLEGQALARLAAVDLTLGRPGDILGRPGDALDDARRAVPADREKSASGPA